MLDVDDNHLVMDKMFSCKIEQSLKNIIHRTSLVSSANKNGREPCKTDSGRAFYVLEK